MIRRPPRSTRVRSSAASDVYKRQIDAPHVSLSLLQSSHLGLARAPIMCSHCPHGKEHVITCLALLFLASGTAPDLIHEPRNSLLSPSLSKNSAAQVVVVGLLQFSSSCTWSMHLLPHEDLISFPERELNVDLNYYVHMQNHAAPPPQDARAHCPANALFSDFNPAPNTCVSVCVCLCVCVSVCVYVCVCVSS